ncbi:phosphoserine phosphatase SerB [Limibacillus halophilus]|uniref:Phosphoserine phosphatase n=1 Tax=Limibacillus halophilus TaxID=1579333 RepID=A0A839SRY7_9PROT|nr:phosphoserine phosphatase SerB [Limibacillus halophilus]MBB3064739.1 phosphoserine phosphatase [Limibacillus halophilus]
MDNVLTLLGTPLAEWQVSAVAEALEINNDQIVWLAEGQAADLFFEHIEPEEAEADARRILEDSEVDMAAQPVPGRRKRLLIADMESTIIEEEMLDELAEMAGLGDAIAEITARSMSGELDFEQSLKQRVALLEGLPLSLLEEAAELMTVNPGGRRLVQTMRQHGAYTMLVSGGFKVFTDRVHEALGFHESRANDLLHSGALLTGSVRDPVLDRNAKLTAMREACSEHHLQLSEAVAVGDGANDLAMVTSAGMGVAYRGKAILREAARFKLDHFDLTGLLYYQGYKASDIRD